MTEEALQEIHYRAYTFLEDRPKKSLSLLAILQDPSRSKSQAIIDGIRKSKKGGFYYRLGEFLYENKLLEENGTSDKDVNGLGLHCDIIGYENKKANRVYLLIKANFAERECPGILDRLKHNDLGNRICMTDYFCKEDLPKNMQHSKLIQE